MKKVLFFLESLGGGGAEKVLSDIVSSIDMAKFDVTVCTVVDNGVYEPIVSQYAHYYSMLKKADYLTGGISRVLYWCKQKCIYHLPRKWVYHHFIRQDYDVEVAFLEGFSSALISASNNNTSKKIAWVHTDFSNPVASPANKKYYHNSIYKPFDTVCCVSQQVLDSFKSFVCFDKRTVVQLNPINYEAIISLSKESIDLNRNTRLQLITVGRLEQPKGFLRLLDLLGRPENRQHDYSLWIVGEGSQRQLLESRINAMHLQAQVQLLGYQDNPYKYISHSDAFVCSSYVEGFSTAATEAIVLDKPVFTTDCSGMHELFGSYRCGEIVNNTDTDLAQMVCRILSKQIDVNDYYKDVHARAMELQADDHIEDIERLLDE